VSFVHIKPPHNKINRPSHSASGDRWAIPDTINQAAWDLPSGAPRWDYLPPDYSLVHRKKSI
jgi:hypothetical protein